MPSARILRKAVSLVFSLLKRFAMPLLEGEGLDSKKIYCSATARSLGLTGQWLL